MPNNVPRFTSFHPKSKSSGGEQRPDTRSESPHLKHEHKAGHKPGPSRRHRVDHRSDSRGSALGQPIVDSRRRNSVEQLWKQDRTGKPTLFQFESPHTWSPSNPSRIKPLGHESSHYAVQDGHWRPLTALSRHELRVLDSESISVDRRRKSASDLLDGEKDGLHSHDFIPLTTGRKRKRKSELVKQHASHVATPQEDQSSSSDPDSDEKDEKSSPDKRADMVRRRNTQLQERLKLHPTDVQAWLEYVTFQEDWAVLGLNADGTHSKVDKTTVSKLKLTVIESACKSVPRTQEDYEKLLMCKLDIDEALLSPADMLQELRDMTRSNPGLGAVALQLLTRLQVQVSSVDTCRDGYKQVLGVQQDDMEQKSVLHVLVRLTTFLRNIGHQELAAAIWQTALELSLYPAEAISSAEARLSKLDIRAKFEAFWDSESPRIGEAGAGGWRNNQLTTPAEPDNTHQRQVTPPGGITAWAVEEDKQSRAFRKPRKTLDNNPDDDPYHTVLFADIDPFFDACNRLFLVDDLLNAVLLYCGLPELPPKHDRGDEDEYPNSHHDGLVYENLSGACQTSKQELCLSNDGSSFRDSLNGLRLWLTCTNTLFGCSDFTNFRAINESYRTFVENVLVCAINARPEDHHVAEYYLAYVCSQSPQRARRMAKSLIKQRPDSLPLYNAFALMELRATSVEASDRVFVTSINLGRKLPDMKAKDVVLLWRTWVWMTLRCNDDPLVALSRLVMFTRESVDAKATKQKVSRTDLLRTKDTLRTNLRTALDSGQMSHALAYIDLLMYLAYVTATSTSEPSLYAALDAHTSCMIHITTKSASEYTNQSFCLLALHHIRTYARVPASPDLLKCVELTATRYAHNYVILETLLAVMPRTDRIRMLLPSALNLREPSPVVEPKTLTAWTLAIETEINRSSEFRESGTGERAVRRTFKRATHSEAGMHCPTLWSWWLNWEADLAPRTPDGKESVKEKGMKWKSAKDVWKKGLVALPWVKSWLLRGLVLFADENVVGGEVVDLEQGRRLVEELREKGFRLYVDFKAAGE